VPDYFCTVSASVLRVNDGNGLGTIAPMARGGACNSGNASQWVNGSVVRISISNKPRTRQTNAAHDNFGTLLLHGSVCCLSQIRVFRMFRGPQIVFCSTVIYEPTRTSSVPNLLRTLRPFAGENAVLSGAPHFKTALSHFFTTIAAKMAARGIPWQLLSSRMPFPAGLCDHSPKSRGKTSSAWSSDEGRASTATRLLRCPHLDCASWSQVSHSSPLMLVPRSAFSLCLARCSRCPLWSTRLRSPKGGRGCRKSFAEEERSILRALRALNRVYGAMPNTQQRQGHRWQTAVFSV
jgi:hypothetical protein